MVVVVAIVVAGSIVDPPDVVVVAANVVVVAPVVVVGTVVELPGAPAPGPSDWATASPVLDHANSVTKTARLTIQRVRRMRAYRATRRRACASRQLRWSSSP
jgi:hypothetical protein